MMAEKGRKIIIVTVKTILEELILRYNTAGQAKFYLEHGGGDFDAIAKEDEIYRTVLKETIRTAERYARVQIIEKHNLPNMIPGADDVVIAVGRDGLIANTMKYLEGQPLIGVNPDPERIDGILLPFEAGDLERILPAVFTGRFDTRRVTMAEAETADGQRLLAANDLFIGARTHVSARYEIRVGDTREVQSSSGVIVSTGLGATGWMKSVMTQAAGIAALQGQELLPYIPPSFDSDHLQFAVREPFPGKTFGTSVVYGTIEKGSTITLVSRMPENGVLFSDGIEEDAIEFRSGMTVRIGIAKKAGALVW